MKLQWEKWDHPIVDLLGRTCLRAKHRDQQFAVVERVSDGHWTALIGHARPERAQDFDTCAAAIAACEEMVRADS